MDGYTSTTSPDCGRRIRKLRVQLGLTQTRLAELLGVSFVTVSRWENNQSQPSQPAWKRILLGERYGLDGLAESFEPAAVVRESAGAYVTRSVAPGGIPDFTADSELVRLVAEGHRLTYGHLFNPVFATETAIIDPLPHQRIAVYEHMLGQPRLRFLDADDAGAGKTIMSGLYLREMLGRRLIRRALVVVPAGLVGNWRREMHQLFSLPFRVISGAEARSGNPFVGPGSDLLVVSIDTLRGDTMFARLQEPDVPPYDLVIFDEAHKLSARRDPDGTIRKTDRYLLAEALCGIPADSPRWRLSWSAQHVLLLTATPHMGKDFPYYCLWRLLEPDVLATEEAFKDFGAEARARHFIRRTKEEMVRFDGRPIYPVRVSDTLSYDLTQGDISEQMLYDRTTAYIETYYNQARFLNRTAAHFAMSIFQRRLASSTWALLRSLERRFEKLTEYVQLIESGELTAEELLAQQRRLDEVDDVYEAMTADEEAAVDGEEEVDINAGREMSAVAARSLVELEVERRQVSELVLLAKQVYALGQESKFEKLRDDILTNPEFAGEKILIFTEHRDTLDFLLRRLEGLGYTDRIAHIHGGMEYSERDRQVEFFRRPNDQGGAPFLIATDAAGEGINLQFAWIMVNYDVPWNPARLEQRMGRIHRYGQKHDPVVIMNLVAGKTREGRVLKTLLNKLERIRKELGSGKVYDVIGRVFQDFPMREYLAQAVTDKGADAAIRRVEGQL